MIPDKSVEILLGELSRDIAQRTPGTGDFPTAVEGLELFRRNEPAPPVSCLVPPSIVLVAAKKQTFNSAHTLRWST
ncbi:hypothetical protein ACLBPK_03900, partial [Klebsiella pneumoniae]